jgi:hypothetical protein
MAIASDALQQDWSKEKNYVFLPFCLIMRSVAKIEETRGRADISCPIVAHTSLVPQLIGPVSVPPGSSANEPESLAASQGDTPAGTRRRFDVEISSK